MSRTLLPARRVLHAPRPARGRAGARARRRADRRVVVHDGEVLGGGRNERELRQDPTAHAEVLALREAAAKLGTWRVLDSVALRDAGAVRDVRRRDRARARAARRLRRGRPEGGRGRQRARRARRAAAQPPPEVAAGLLARGVRRRCCSEFFARAADGAARATAYPGRLRSRERRRRGGGAVEWGGLENRYGRFGPSRVRIPPPPLTAPTRRLRSPLAGICRDTTPRSYASRFRSVRARAGRSTRDWPSGSRVSPPHGVG